MVMDKAGQVQEVSRKAYVPECDMGDLQGAWPKISTFPNYIGSGIYDDKTPWKLGFSRQVVSMTNAAYAARFK